MSKQIQGPLQGNEDSILFFPLYNIFILIRITYYAIKIIITIIIIITIRMNAEERFAPRRAETKKLNQKFET